MNKPERRALSAERIEPEVLPWGSGELVPRAVAPEEKVGGFRERLVLGVAQRIAHLVVHKSRPEELRFGRVTTPEQLAAVGRMRRRVYEVKLPYLLQELREDGTDEHDAHSFVFAVWLGDRVVASLRATRYPYETLRYVSEAELSGWMKEGWNTDYIEWGRLLVDTTEGLRRLTPALLTYASVHLFFLTPYRKFFGYFRPQVYQAVGGFQRDPGEFTFRIPHRGEHSYVVLKGEFLKSLLWCVPNWLRALPNRVLKPRASKPARQPLTPPL